jgi:hypothetical protein
MFGNGKSTAIAVGVILLSAALVQLWWCYASTELPVPLVTGPLLALCFHRTGRSAPARF